MGRTLFGVQWQGEASDPDRLQRLLDWTLSLYRAVEGGRVPEGLFDFFSGKHTSLDLLAQSKAVAERMDEALLSVQKAESLLRFARTTPLKEEPLAQIGLRLERWSSELGRLGEIADYNRLREEAVADGLTATVTLADTWPLASQRLSDSYLRGWLEGTLAEALEARPILKRFERTRYEALIQEFRTLDEASLAYNRAQVAHVHLQSVAGVSSDFGNAAELKRQCQLRKGHRPIRWAMERMPELIQRIKPVFLMSPLSVPSFLPPRKDLFDVVIFDEASQVKPEDALSAIARGRQVVVVGDSKQMPPTSFFEKLSQSEEIDEEGEGDAAVGKLESVLALFASSVTSEARRRWLRWHYRSLHPALIQPSNNLFYENRLVVPPSPVYATGETSSSMGVVLHYDPTNLYERSGSRKNPKQAHAVALAVLDHIRAKPQETLLVVAFSKAQQEAIEDELELLRKEDPGMFDAFAALHPHEPLTVKNLETVQGDERDVTFVSVGYGRDSDGKLTMNFGPINAEGGERRLNVLMTRARKRCEVFSSLRSGDIALGDNPKFGVQALKQFLEFAETGHLDLPAPTGHEADSIFEEQVARAIEAHGYKVDLQVGSLGFRIDLAVRHPQRPGYYVLGVECDGASYHSSRSARDRDKIRQSVLESRGWQLYRVWSTDWWRDPEAETRRLLAAITAAVDRFILDEELLKSAPAPTAKLPDALQVYQDDTRNSKPMSVPYQAWDRPFDLDGQEIQALSPSVIAGFVAAVVTHEGPIHRDLLLKRIRESVGLGRMGSKAQAAIEAGINAAVRLESVTHRDGFYYGPRAISARDRSLLGSDERRAEWIAPEEIEAAILAVVGSAYGISRNDLPRAVRDVFGFSSASSKMSERVVDVANLLISSDRLVQDGTLLRLPSEGS
jgi:very-short-patch-repair endonuclease